MTNGEKYKNEILAITKRNHNFAIDNNTEEIKICGVDILCNACRFSGNTTCSIPKTNWLLSDYEQEKEVELTQDEYSFLYLLGYGYLVREKTGYLDYYRLKPEYDSEKGEWGDGIDDTVFFNTEIFERLKDSFEFIKASDKPYDIEKMLKYAKKPQETHDKLPDTILNIDKYREDIIKVIQEHNYFSFNKKTKKIDNCGNIDCEDCAFSDKLWEEECSWLALKWLFKEYKEKEEE